VAVPRIGRALDLAAAALVVVGGALYARAYIGLEALRARPLAEFSVGMEIGQLAEFHSLERLSLAGLAVAILGICVAITAAIVARRFALARTGIRAEA
jgi:hypothetical protein